MMRYGPIGTVGWCLGPDDLESDIYSVVDFDAPIRAGDEVAVFMRQRTSFKIGFKLVQQTRDGAWWFTWFANPEHTQRLALPVQHPYLANKLMGIAAVVERTKIRRRIPRAPYVSNADAHFIEWLAGISEPAVREWREHGYPVTDDVLRFDTDPTVLRGLRKCA